MYRYAVTVTTKDYTYFTPVVTRLRDVQSIVRYHRALLASADEERYHRALLKADLILVSFQSIADLNVVMFSYTDIIIYSFKVNRY
ncbi:hypothetical protein RCL_jg8703.t1 [Rhizophagus clarus]|uniref:Uncharacterized protein n=1 Tax=Rhizophagus clarus TaxID=94130 RepID=A0A8H3QZ53_9GLOM|nr:hypothetical protein RCL_jg8703.t1 [Rhizophagus clarus]